MENIKKKIVKKKNWLTFSIFLTKIYIFLNEKFPNHPLIK